MSSRTIPDYQSGAAPADVLKSLLSSMEEVRRDVSRLRNDNANLRIELQRLQENSGASFHRFPKLPMELQRMIWTAALTTPQILVISDHRISRSHVNSIMQACKEARDTGLNLRLPYFQISTSFGWAEDDTKQYFNIDVDTIWLEGCSLIPDCVEFFCGICPRAGMFPMITQILNECSHNLRLKRLAINDTEWVAPLRWGIFEQKVVDTTDVLRHVNSAEELYLVVGDTTASKDRNVFFDAPKRMPFQELRDLDSRLDLPRFMGRGFEPNSATSWRLAEQELEETFEYFKKDRAFQRKHEIEVNGRDDWELSENNFIDVSDWKPPKVRYVEAFTDRNLWIRPPHAYARQ